ncbi:MAG: hypothetical protein F6K55_42280 [Moorea sp. SIO4A3]|nr:hypothetical protein [Moorena sp. SIO4A3]
MAENRTINIKTGNYFENPNLGDYIQGNYYAGSQQNLSEAAEEIKKLLEQITTYHPDELTEEKLAAEVINCIENNPTLMERIISALKAGGISAFEQTLNHPAASFVIGALGDWQQTKVDQNQ